MSFNTEEDILYLRGRDTTDFLVLNTSEKTDSSLRVGFRTIYRLLKRSLSEENDSYYFSKYHY